MPKPRIISKDWRSLPLDNWNTATVIAYFTDMNRIMYGVETYLPFRNWNVERGMIKNALSTYGPVILRQAFDECFRTYRPTREYPLLTAGFAISYRINAIIPKLLTAKAEEVTEQAADVGAVKAWL